MAELKVLVLGDGLLGSELVRQTGWDYVSRKDTGFDINKLHQSIPTESTGRFLSAWSTESGMETVPTHNVIVNCIANTDTYSTDRESHWKVNYQFVNNLIEYCNMYHIKLVHISTDYLYAGSINCASEVDVPVPCDNWYGYTKLLADGLVQLKSHDYLICRCTHKPRPFPYDIAWIDQVGNFDYVDVIGGLIIELINKEASGVYNVGTEVKTMYDLAIETRDVGKSFTPPHIPKNQSMNLTKLNSKISEA